ncbi:MAG: cupin domain-containing protein [Xenococcus sp. (in: cyanobacteria)]
MIINPEQVPEKKGTNYPEAFKHLVSGRTKKRLGDAAGLKNFGVNLVTLEPGSCSSIRHWHLRQDEFIYIIEGPITLVTDEGEEILQTGAMAGFPAGEANGHHVNYPPINRGLEIPRSQQRVALPHKPKYDTHFRILLSFGLFARLLGVVA